MAVAPGISITAALAACNAIVDLVDGGAGAGTLTIFEGTQPTYCDTADAGTALAIITLLDPAFGNAADVTPHARATLDLTGGIGDASANATGTAQYFRIKDSNGVVHLQGSCGTSAADMILVSTSITATQPVNITACTFTHREV